MHNPFDDLGKPRLNTDDGEDISGNFSCQTFGCFEHCTDAKFKPDTGQLTWVCADGHVSQIKNFRIDF